MSKEASQFLIIALVTVSLYAYAIEGTWKLTDVQNLKLPDNHPAKIEVTDFIFRNATIRWKLTYTGCQTIKSIIDIQNNNIYVDSPTIFKDNQSLQNCSAQYLKPQKLFYESLNKVFTFQIFQKFMIFSDPEGSVLFKFERIVKNSARSQLLGIWMINTLNGAQIDQIMQIGNDTVIFCQRLAQANYRIQSSNKFAFANNTDNKCGSKKLLSVFNSSKYFVKRNNTLQVYDQNDQLVLGLTYVMNLQTARKLKQQQDQQAKNYVPPPPTPLMIQNARSALVSSTAPPAPSPTISDLSGKWSITKTSNGFNASETSFIITKTLILLANECITYTISYSEIIPNPITISQQNLKQSINQCPLNSKGINQNDIIKIYRFQVEMQETKTIARVYGQDRSLLFQIQKPGKLILQSKPVPAQPILPPPVFAQPIAPSRIALKSDIIQGRYTILLLRKRDIPRKIIDISNNSFSLKICNQITVKATVTKSKSIAFNIQTNQSNISAPCDPSQQNFIISALSSAASYQNDEQDYIIKDKDNKEIISLVFIA